MARLKRGGWTLLDTQFLTEHLTQFGAVETPQAAYLKRLLQPALTVLAQQAAQPARAHDGADAVVYALQPTTQAS